ncbi:hypothetical protein JW916_02085 [Candidatus Sumerlaeota bacterium]|nr:hypothetical protein [Candidatus Sumerlaeota bacterium]
MRLNLDKWQTWAGIGVVVLLVWWRMAAIDRSMPTDKIAEVIRNRVTRDFSPMLAEAKAMQDAGKTEYAAERIEEFRKQVRGVSVQNLKVRGIGRYRIVRAEIRVNGAPPPNGRSVRYYRFRYTYVSGWMFNWEVSAWRYWLALF